MAWGRLDPGFVVLWLCASAALLVPTAPWVLRPGGRGSWRRAVRRGAYGMPLLAVVVSALVFGGARVHPLVQYNTHALGAWRVWAVSWPLLFLGSFAAVVLGLGLAVGSGGQTWWDRLRWLLLMAANALALFAVASNWPDV